jgi:alanine racemase
VRETLELRTLRFRPTVAVVDLAAVRHNVERLLPGRARLMAVVKANGYGHGAIPVARAALAAGATWLGVALVEEGIRLRDAGITAPVLVLTQFPPGSEPDALAARLTPTLYTGGGLDRLAVAARTAPGPIGVHVKVDTGMHRVGLAPEDAPAFLEEVRRRGLEVEGLWTHLAKSEELEDPFSGLQMDRFRGVVDEAHALGITPRFLHAANSGALLSRPETHLDLVRAGIGVYGLSPGTELDGEVARLELRPALTWRSEVVLTRRVAAGDSISYGLRYRVDRTSTIATVPVGYADGYSRRLSEGGRVLVRGRRYPIAGTVTMDQLMVDCGDDPVGAGDEVVLIGRQGDEEIGAAEVGAWMGSVAYEVVCGVSERVPREYVGGEV